MRQITTTTLAFHEFKQVFPDEETCLKYLLETKWKDGFKCPRCGNHKFCQGRTAFHYQCTRCKYQDSPTSHTIFHRVRFPLHKAFYIIFFMLKRHKRVTSTELSQKIELRQKTCWVFQEKVRHKLYSKDYDELVKILEDAEKYFQQIQLTNKRYKPIKLNPSIPSTSASNQRRSAARLLSEE